ncbi:MAG: hypothetical protein NVS9B14_21570 [Candidatus Acidiferrum sp.]
MKLVIRLVAGRCEGCGAVADVEEQRRLCLYCFGLWLAVERKREKLQDTLRVRFAAIGARVREQLKEFARI